MESLLCCQNIRISGVESNWYVIISGIPQQIQGQILINVSINERSAGNDGKSSSSLQVTPTQGPRSKLEGRTVIQRYFNNLEKWADRNVMELNSGKLKSIRLEKDLNVTFNFLERIYREDGARLLSEFHRKRARGNEQSLQKGKL
ncbi:hypothetical protein WISP_136801 [Willisornis vidua]|uniref:Uncharacterized protein n=1 Tax=Willisornis vidua TaxID=1566151 RepID=A0ABQ9CT18_9PASS|nr:hypothetical protein WISP_136801 [Willisornis vidua]